MLHSWANTLRATLTQKLRLMGRVLPSSPHRYILAAMMAFAPSIVSSSSISAETSKQKAIETALTACAQLPDGKDKILTVLEGNGWVKSDNALTLHDLFASSTFAFKHSTEDAELLEKSIENAFFMAASILGNSALPPNQPAFVLDDISIGVIGLTLSRNGSPYCVISGPATLFDLFANKMNLAPKEAAAHGFMKKPQGLIHEGQYMNAVVSVSVIDLDRILSAGRKFKLFENPDMPDLTLETALEHFRPFNAYISPQRSSDGD